MSCFQQATHQVMFCRFVRIEALVDYIYTWMANTRPIGPPRCSTAGQAPAASGYMCTEVPDGYALWDKRSQPALN